ncbi:MAG: hypothetical protein Roseis2KO_55500 [Roseivirga sp.]
MVNRKALFIELKTLGWWYAGTAAVIVAGLYLLVVFNDFGGESDLSLWLQLLEALTRFTIVYFLALIPYLLFVLIRSLVRDYKRKCISGLAKGFGLKMLTPTLVIWGSLQLIDGYRLNERFEYEWDHSIENQTATIRNHHQIDGKQRGIHVFDLLQDTADLDTLKTHNFEWLTLVPYISQEEYDQPTIRVNFQKNDSTPRFQSIRKIKELAEVYQFKIMLKPHIWLSNTSDGIWRSNIEMKSEADWDKWFSSYERLMLSYAQLAEELEIELFCIGTELKTPVMLQPERWLSLIRKIRAVYSGKLTYGANWDAELSDFPFWNELDFIGIQAYFPIAKNRFPDIAELEEGWKAHFAKLNDLHARFGKPVLFTELGYKSTPNAGIAPWEWNDFQNRFYRKISKKTQALCYEAFFNTVWQQDWFAGVHVWQWQSRGNSQGNNNSFGIQGKPALNVIAKGFSQSEEK